MENRMILAGDIGGTNTRLAYFDTSQGLSAPIHPACFKNKQYSRVEDLLDRYLESHPQEFSGLCLGIAGPVIEDRVDITNLGWEIDGRALEQEYHLHGVWLLNDLEALCYAVLQLPEEDLAVLREGRAVEGAPIGVIAPGTGLGEGFLIQGREGYQAVSTEGGHADFGPVNPLQVELLTYLQEQGIRVSYEQVCSGIGVSNLYRFLRDSGYAPEPEWFREELDQVQDLTPLIFNTALDPSQECPLCEMALNLFVAILGAEIGNLALKTLALGGIFIGGGIPPRIIPWLKKDSFLQALDAKDPHREMMEEIPVKVILNPSANLIGAAHFGQRKLTLLRGDQNLDQGEPL